MTSGRLTLVAGPIGNLQDLSPRAAKALEEAELWIVEDTRVSARLQSFLKLKRPMRVLNEHTAPSALRKLADEAEGRSVALLSDAGTPGISDPGAELVDELAARACPIDAVPGPSAVTTALMLSGFYAQRFAFLGFLGRRSGQIASDLGSYADSTLTLALFESPHRLEKLLLAASEHLGPRRYVICRELTKIHQQVYRGRLPQVPTASELPRKGEITLVIEGRRRK